MGSTVTKRSVSKKQMGELCRDVLALRAKGAECYKEAGQIMEELLENGAESGDVFKFNGQSYALLDTWEGKTETGKYVFIPRFAVESLKSLP